MLYVPQKSNKQPSLDFNVAEYQISIKLMCEKNLQLLTTLSSQTNRRHHTSGCHKSSIPLTGSVLWAVLRLVLAASFCWTGCDSFFFLLAPKQPKLSPEKRKQKFKKLQSVFTIKTLDETRCIITSHDSYLCLCLWLRLQK